MVVTVWNSVQPDLMDNPSTKLTIP